MSLFYSAGLGGSAIPDREDWERDDPLSDYDGNTAAASITQSNVLEGLNALQFDSNAGEAIYNTSEIFNEYPSKGDVFSVLLRETSSRDRPIVLFGLSASSATDFNCYGIADDRSDQGGRARIVRFDSGSKNNLTTETNTGLTNGDWYDYEIEWHDGSGSEVDNQIVVNIYNVDVSSFDPSANPSDYRTTKEATFSANDGTYSGQVGIGWVVVGGSSSTAVGDFYRITGSV